MNYMAISQDNCNEINFSEIATIHYDALSYRSNIALYGKDFLAEIYKIIVSSKIGFLVIAKDADTIIGFTCGIIDNSKLMKILAFSWYKLIFKMFIAVCQRPMLIVKTIEMLKYSASFSKVRSEMLSIAVEEPYRGQKIGFFLVSELEKEFLKRKIDTYQVTVHSEMIQSNNFYDKNQMQISNKFIMLNTEWNLWIKKIEKERN